MLSQPGVSFNGALKHAARCSTLVERCCPTVSLECNVSGKAQGKKRATPVYGACHISHSCSGVRVPCVHACVYLRASEYIMETMTVAYAYVHVYARVRVYVYVSGSHMYIVERLCACLCVCVCLSLSLSPSLSLSLFLSLCACKHLLDCMRVRACARTSALATTSS